MRQKKKEKVLRMFIIKEPSSNDTNETISLHEQPTGISIFPNKKKRKVISLPEMFPG